MKKTSEYNAFISKRKSVAFGSNYTAERVSKNHIIDNYVLQRSLVAYHVASSLVDGNVLEIGTGMGYGIEIIAPHTTHFTSIDKHVPPIDLSGLQNVTLKKLKVPRLKGIASETYDFVICFQVIEHIENDELLIQEIERVLKPGGTFIVSTPNKLNHSGIHGCDAQTSDVRIFS
jgi:2-polyprenyl-3-methyl-5-hydroxy-6-metoxy-1,4-benzoquinol methylase